MTLCQIAIYDCSTRECPACGSQGWVAGDVSAVHVYDGGQVTVSPKEVLLDPYGFHCAACDLEVGTKLLMHMGDLVLQRCLF
ncbi:hypothetical protein GCM10023220_68480 [Streptomyces ziwulingensis]|uniref:Uncharacterized protein n=1 Tax=Streptomyces ziwulingensis TaxID=1045501 RepID=A0ABP9D316_9ACTN